MHRKMLCRLLCCIAILCLTVTSVSATAWFYGSDRTGSISFNFAVEGQPTPSGHVDLRQVAVWNNEIKKLEWTVDFAALGYSIDDLIHKDLSDVLFLKAESAGLPAQSIAIGADGKGRAEDLALGVYLVSQMVPFEGYYCIRPALVCVPLNVDEDEWIYDVDAMPKLEPIILESIPSEPTTEPTPPDLPPTGQTNWPVPLLALGGSFLLVLGLCLRKEKRHAANR